MGASARLLPLAIWYRIQMGDLKSINIRLYLADDSCVSHTVIIEDVLIQVGKFIVPVNFIVMNIAAEVEVPIILGRPFLATVGALINVKEG